MLQFPNSTLRALPLFKSRFHLVYNNFPWLRGEFNSASSGFGLWAKTLRGQWDRISLFFFNLIKNFLIAKDFLPLLKQTVNKLNNKVMLYTTNHNHVQAAILKYTIAQSTRSTPVTQRMKCSKYWHVRPTNCGFKSSLGLCKISCSCASSESLSLFKVFTAHLTDYIIVLQQS